MVRLINILVIAFIHCYGLRFYFPFIITALETYSENVWKPGGGSGRVEAAIGRHGGDGQAQATSRRRRR